MAIDADIIAFREMESVTGDDDSGEMAIADIGGIFFPELQSLFTENMDQKGQTLIPEAAVSIAIWNGTGMMPTAMIAKQLASSNPVRKSSKSCCQPKRASAQSTRRACSILSPGQLLQFLLIVSARRPPVAAGLTSYPATRSIRPTCFSRRGQCWRADMVLGSRSSASTEPIDRSSVIPLDAPVRGRTCEKAMVMPLCGSPGTRQTKGHDAACQLFHFDL